ncbi:MAG: hypothetical protein AAF676_01585, partial [Pseudomonadota bacterium]
SGPRDAMAQVALSDDGDALTLNLIDAFGEDWSAQGAGQDVAWAVFEAGTWVLEDGTVLQVGETDASGAGALSRADFEDGLFDAAPSILTQVQDGDGWLVARQDGGDASGVDLRVQAPEGDAAAGAHSVGWLAIEQGGGDWDGLSWQAGELTEVTDRGKVQPFQDGGLETDPAFFAAVSSLNGGDPALAQTAFVSQSGALLRVAEERTGDDEVRHVAETIDFVAFGGDGLLTARLGPGMAEMRTSQTAAAAVRPDAQGEPGEARAIAQIGQTMLDHETITLTLDHEFENPVAFALAPSALGPDAAIAEIVEVDGDQLSLRLREPDGYDLWHVEETVTWMVVEAGSWRLSNGARLEAGISAETGWVQDGFERIDFDGAFADAPAILSQAQAEGGADWMVARQQGAGAAGFEAALQRAEAADLSDGAAPAPLGWLAIEQGTGEWDGMAYEAASTDERFDHAADRFEFTAEFDDAPLALAALSSFQGGDTAALRRESVDAEGLNLFVMEEKTRDGELRHVPESVDVFAFEGAGLLTGSAWDALA